MEPVLGFGSPPHHVGVVHNGWVNGPSVMFFGGPKDSNYHPGLLSSCEKDVS